VSENFTTYCSLELLIFAFFLLKYSLCISMQKLVCLLFYCICMSKYTSFPNFVATIMIIVIPTDTIVANKFVIAVDIE
jgi:hypothetical protein